VPFWRDGYSPGQRVEAPGALARMAASEANARRVKSPVARFPRQVRARHGPSGPVDQHAQERVRKARSP
jgi:hypothetical protein